jgi:hypothetical protein
MRIFGGAVAAPIIVGVLSAATGCGSTAAADSGTPHSTASSATTAVAASTPSVPGPSTAPTTGAATTSVSTPFPGIWDITSWQAYRTAQTAVEQGHQPWLLDPASVVRAWAASRWTTAPAVRQITADSFQLTEPGTTVVFTVRGTRPDPTGAAPIWVITAITHS